MSYLPIVYTSSTQNWIFETSSSSTSLNQLTVSLKHYCYHFNVFSLFMFSFSIIVHNYMIICNKILYSFVPCNVRPIVIMPLTLGFIFFSAKNVSGHIDQYLLWVYVWKKTLTFKYSFCKFLCHFQLWILRFHFHNINKKYINLTS